MGRGLFERLCFLVAVIEAFGERRCWFGGLRGGGLVYQDKKSFWKGTEYWSEAFGNYRKGSVVSFACRPLEWVDVEVGCFSVMILGAYLQNNGTTLSINKRHFP